jgi:hypothetical protein
MGDEGGEETPLAEDKRVGVEGAVAVAEMDREGVFCCEILVMSGNIVANKSVEGSEALGDAVEERGPVRPRGFEADKRPSQTPSNSTVLGGSCFVASPAA